MSLLRSVKLSGVDYSTADFIKRFSSKLPLIAVTTSGMDGEDQIHCISAEEMYWIRGFQRQKRIVAKEVDDSKNATFPISIPIDYPHNFHWVKPSGQKLSRPMPLQAVTEMMKTSPPNEHLITFENSKNVSFNFLGTKSSCKTFGVMQVIDVYEQNHLVGHSIYDDVIDPVPLAIPVYMEITFDVAVGIKDLNREEFQRWMEAANNIGSSFGNQPAQLSSAIIRFREIPSNGHYEYLQPFMYVGKNNNSNKHYTSLQPLKVNDTNPTTDDKNCFRSIRRFKSDNEPDFGEDRPQLPEARLQKQTRLPPFSPISPPISPADVLGNSSNQDCDDKPPPPVPTRKRQPDSNMAAQPIELPIVYDNRPEGRISCDQSFDDDNEFPPVPPRRYLTEPESIPRQAESCEDNNAFPPFPPRRYLTEPESIPRQAETSGVYDEIQEVVGLLPRSRATLVSSTGGAGLDRSATISAGDEEDLDVTGLSVDDVAQCLCLMGFSEQASQFRECSVDGHLLKVFDETILINDFNFTPSDADKIMKFINGRMT